jgi:hypothetical protein
VEYRKTITRTFSTLFNEQIEVGDDEVEGGFGKFWGYYIWISQLADNDIGKINTVTSQPLVLCLNHLSYLMDLHQEQDKAMKKMMKTK